MPTLHFTIFMNCFFSVSNINLLSVQSVRLGCFSCLIARGGLLRFWCFNNIYINSSHTVYRAEKWKNYSDSMSVLRRIYDTTKSYFETRGKIFENFFPSEFLKLLETLWINTTLIGINMRCIGLTENYQFSHDLLKTILLSFSLFFEQENWQFRVQYFFLGAHLIFLQRIYKIRKWKWGISLFILIAVYWSLTIRKRRKYIVLSWNTPSFHSFKHTTNYPS